MKAAPLTILALASILGCSTDDPIVPRREIVASFPLQMQPGSGYIVPDTVTAGVPFAVTIFPRLGCGSDAIPALVSINGNVADVTARAVIPRHHKDAAFTCEGRVNNWSSGVVVFRNLGPAEVRLHGKSGPLNAGDTTVVVSVHVRSP